MSSMPPAATMSILYGAPFDFVWQHEEVHDQHFPGVVFVKCTSCLMVDTRALVGSAYLAFVALYAHMYGWLVGPLPLYNDGLGHGGSPAM